MAPLAPFSTWLEAIQASPTFKRSSTDLALARSVLREATPEKALSNLSKEPDSILVFASEPDGRITTIHQVKDIGSNRFHPQEIPFAILGLLQHEAAVTFKPTSFFAEIPSGRNKAPRIPADMTTFLETDTAEKLAALHATISNNEKSANSENWKAWNPKHSILVPTFLAEALSKHENSDPTEGYLAVRQEIEVVINAAPTNNGLGPEDREELYSILAFFYLLSQHKIPKLVIQPCVTEPWISALAEMKRARMVGIPGLAQPPPPQAPAPAATTETPPNWQTVVPAIVDLTARSMTTSKTGFDALPEQKKKFILIMSTTDGQSPAVQINPDYQEFLKCKNIKEGEDLLKSSIASKYGISSELSGAIASNLFLGRFLWSRPDIPNGGYSILLQSRMKASDIPSLSATSGLEIDLRIQNGDTLSDAIMGSLVKGKLRLPITVDDLLHQLRNDQRTMGFTFGQDSLLFHILNLVPKCIEDNHLAFDSQQMRNPKFPAMIAHQVDLQKQLLFRQADTASDINSVDFAAFETQLRFVCSQVLSRTFHMEIPLEITQDGPGFQLSRDNQPKRGPRITADHKASKRPNVSTRNEHPIQGIILAEGEQWSKAFPPHGRLPVDKVPKFNGTDTPCCARFHIGGACPAASNCPFALSHSDPDGPTKSSLKRFRSECKQA